MAVAKSLGRARGAQHRVSHIHN